MLDSKRLNKSGLLNKSRPIASAAPPRALFIPREYGSRSEGFLAKGGLEIELFSAPLGDLFCWLWIVDCMPGQYVEGSGIPINRGTFLK